MRVQARRRKPEPTIALINIVFLMLIFFMVAGTLSAPLDPDLTLVETRDLDGREPPNALILQANGDLLFRGRLIDNVAIYVITLDEDRIARIVPDRNAPAERLVSLGRELRAAGAERVMIVTERALQ